jgi:UDP-N-acetylmuramoyl-tripeptide--D-alanyl-D-alanine ligase
MDARSLAWIAAACGGEQLTGSGETPVCRVCSDSRQIQRGDLFFALPGERFDGHAFLGQAAGKGAAAAVVAGGQSAGSLPNCALIAVPDTRQALGRLAARYRRDFSIPVVAVAGSNGKTTTKDLVASVLEQKFATLRSEASFNNDVGVPLTLLGLESVHQAAVLEAGTNHPGELAPLLEMISPGLGVLTSIGREHLEFFGDLAGVAQEEGWLAELLPGEGILFANGDCRWTGPIAGRGRARLVRVGLTEANDWRADNLRLDQQGVAFRVVVLDDAYNANADSMLAALQTLRELPCKGRRVAVLGDMAELGAQSEAAHEEVGRRAAELGIGQLFAVGKMAPLLARGARAAGLNRVLEFADVEGAGLALRQFLKHGDLLLLKASRATRLERIAQMLRGSDALKRN